LKIDHILPWLAFAVRRAQEEVETARCSELFSGEYGEKRNALFRLPRTAGYRLPAVFAAPGVED
jgi:hypothetical protein